MRRNGFQSIERVYQYNCILFLQKAIRMQSVDGSANGRPEKRWWSNWSPEELGYVGLL